MQCDASSLPKSVVADANTIQMPTVQVRVWAENAGVGVSQWVAEMMGIWQDKCGLTTHLIDNEVRERIWDIAQSMSSINKQGAGPEQWDLLIDHCVTQISDLASQWPHWKWYMVAKTILDHQKINTALDEFADVGLHCRKNTLKETLTKKRNLAHCGMYFISPMLHLFFLMMYRYRRRRERNLGSQVFSEKGAL